MKNPAYRIKTFQHGAKGADAVVWRDGRQVWRSPIKQGGDVVTGHLDGGDRRAAVAMARQWIREQRQFEQAFDVRKTLGKAATA